MKHVGRPLPAIVTAVGLALAAAGCGSNVIGADGPRPGIAAQVEETEITLDELESVVVGVCTLQESDPVASATSREFAQAQILRAWVTALVDAEYAEDNGIEASAPDPGIENAPGWEEVDEEDKEPLQSYVDAFVYSSAIQEQASEEEPPDPADYDITINPRFDVRLEGREFVPAGERLSVPVSDEGGTDLEPPTAETLEELPDDELCGKRPDPAAGPAIPMG